MTFTPVNQGSTGNDNRFFFWSSAAMADFKTIKGQIQNDKDNKQTIVKNKRC